MDSKAGASVKRLGNSAEMFGKERARELKEQREAKFSQDRFSASAVRTRDSQVSARRRQQVGVRSVGR